MGNFLSNIFNFFGNKSDKDIQEVMPLIEEIHKATSTLSSHSHDELRNATKKLQKDITSFVAKEEEEIAALKSEIASNHGMDLNKKEATYSRIDKLEKTILSKTEEALMIALPMAFAVVKETARRFKEHEEVQVTATEMDKNLE